MITCEGSKAVLSLIHSVDKKVVLMYVQDKNRDSKCLVNLNKL